RPDADDRRLDTTLVEQAAFGNDGLAYQAVAETRAGQKTWVRVDRTMGIVKAEGRSGTRQHDVGVIERGHGSDVGPVPAEDVRVHLIATKGRGNHLPPEILGQRLPQQLEQDIARE